MGSRLLHKWILRPLLDIKAINTRLDGVEALFYAFSACDETKAIARSMSEATSESSSRSPLMSFKTAQSSSYAERYITDELKELEFKILNAAELAEKRERELYLEVLQTLRSHCGDLNRIGKAVAELDCHVREYGYERNLTHIQAFSRHVRTGYEHDLCVAATTVLCFWTR